MKLNELILHPAQLKKVDNYLILQELDQYASPADKLSRMVQAGEYTSIVKGLYETDKAVPGYYLQEVSMDHPIYRLNLLWDIMD